MSDIENIKNKLNIIDIVRSYVPDLKKSGRNWSAKSPFRIEKTPSFMVNEELGIFKDFGGDKSGDVIKFIQEIEHIENFGETLRYISEKYNIPLQNSRQIIIKKDEKEEKLKSRILELNTFSTNLWTYILNSHQQGNIAKAYCNNRNITKELIDKYKIGYAPKDLDLLQFIQKKLNWDIKDPEILSALSQSGLFRDKGNFIPKFQDRLMFPIKNVNGEIIAFSGRTIEKNDQRPKYINSPDTPIYKKSENIFNIYEATKSIKEKDFTIITEGQIDAIKSSLYNVDNVVAPLGTSLTSEQLKLLSRKSKNIAFCYDNDDAGKKALYRGWELATDAGFNVYVINLPEVLNEKKIKDIDDLVNIAPEVFINVVNNKIFFLDYWIKHKFELSNKDNLIEKRVIFTDILKAIACLNDKLLQDEYFARACKIFDIPDASKSNLFQEFEKYIYLKIKKNSPSPENASINTYPETIPEIYEYQEVQNKLGALSIFDNKELRMLSILIEYPSLRVDFDKNTINTLPIEIFDNYNLEQYPEIEFLICSEKLYTNLDNFEIIKKEFQHIIKYLKQPKILRKIREMRKISELNEDSVDYKSIKH